MEYTNCYKVFSNIHNEFISRLFNIQLKIQQLDLARREAQQVIAELKTALNDYGEHAEHKDQLILLVHIFQYAPHLLL
jgi:hypothetical protein